jgi:hypothetical protein
MTTALSSEQGKQGFSVLLRNICGTRRSFQNVHSMENPPLTRGFATWAVTGSNRRPLRCKRGQTRDRENIRFSRSGPLSQVPGEVVKLPGIALACGTKTEQGKHGIDQLCQRHPSTIRGATQPSPRWHVSAGHGRAWPNAALSPSINLGPPIPTSGRPGRVQGEVG